MTDKKKLSNLSFKKKYKNLCNLDRDIKQCDIARLMKVTASVVSNIKKNREKILAAISSRSLKTEKIKTSKCAIIDEKLCEWFSSLRQENVQINGGLLLEKAQKKADELGLDGFVCNPSWINRFKK
ncbi:hypothetical protein ENBRE01_2964 [Enteropsectra breve]|nr:hypothetical protein ENBRE01_2964 [Enteropsectra breve]